MLYRYEYIIEYCNAPEVNKGYLDIDFRENKNSYTMQVIKTNLKDLPPILDRLLESGKAIIKKRNSKHSMRFGIDKDFFIIYPERLGKPFLFKQLAAKVFEQRTL
jgi:hypothetical protein